MDDAEELRISVMAKVEIRRPQDEICAKYNAVVSMLDCHSRGSGFKSRPGQKFG